MIPKLKTKKASNQVKLIYSRGKEEGERWGKKEEKAVKTDEKREEKEKKEEKY